MEQLTRPEVSQQLKRICIGLITLGNLPVGKWCYLGVHERFFNACIYRGRLEVWLFLLRTAWLKALGALLP